MTVRMLYLTSGKRWQLFCLWSSLRRYARTAAGAECCFSRSASSLPTQPQSPRASIVSQDDVTGDQLMRPSPVAGQHVVKVDDLVLILRPHLGIADLAANRVHDIRLPASSIRRIRVLPLPAAAAAALARPRRRHVHGRRAFDQRVDREDRAVLRVQQLVLLALEADGGEAAGAGEDRVGVLAPPLPRRPLFVLRAGRLGCGGVFMGGERGQF
jgi:hypothetical protein